MSAASTCGWAEGCVATKDHSARRRRLLCGLRARKFERMSEGEGKYHRQWASTVASKASLPSLASGGGSGGDETEVEADEERREER